MWIYVPFAVGAGVFSAMNAVGSVICWYASQRRIMLVTGAINTTIGAAGAVIYPHDVFLSNVYLSAAASCASGQFLLHAVRTPSLLKPSGVGLAYGLWVMSLLGYGINRGKWAYALRFD